MHTLIHQLILALTHTHPPANVHIQPLIYALTSTYSATHTCTHTLLHMDVSLAPTSVCVGIGYVEAVVDVSLENLY